MEKLRQFLVTRPPFVLGFATSIVIGNSFYALIHSLVYNVILPVISMLLKTDKWIEFKLGPMSIGKFLGEIIEFAVIFLIIYLFVTWILDHLINNRADPSQESEIPDLYNQEQYGVPQPVDDFPYAEDDDDQYENGDDFDSFL